MKIYTDKDKKNLFTDYKLNKDGYAILTQGEYHIFEDTWVDAHEGATVNAYKGSWVNAYKGATVNGILITKKNLLKF